MSEIVEQKRNVPKLRFPEFSGQWKTCPSKEEFNYRNGLNFTRGSIGETIKVVGVADFQQNTRLFGSDKLTAITIHGQVNQNDLLANGDLLFVRSNGNKALIGRCLQIQELGEKISFSGFTIRGRSKGGCISSDFASLLFRSDRFRNYLNVAGGGTNISNLSQTILEEYPLTFPDEKEQQRIASFLSAVDEKIAQLQEKKSLLEDYKKGCMQKLFSQTLRFKDDDGNDYPDWAHLSAGDLFQSISNKKHSGELPILAITQDMGATFRDNLEKDIYSSEASIQSYKVVEPGDFIISLRSFQGGLEYSKILGICSPAYTIVRATKPICDDFFKNYFKKEDFISRLSATVVGIREGKQISYGAFSTLTLPFPTIGEQQKIANFLSAIDDKITHATTQLEQTKTFKKGLLQKMFV